MPCAKPSCVSSDEVDPDFLLECSPVPQMCSGWSVTKTEKAGNHRTRGPHGRLLTLSPLPAREAHVQGLGVPGAWTSRETKAAPPTTAALAGRRAPTAAPSLRPFCPVQAGASRTPYRGHRISKPPVPERSTRRRRTGERTGSLGCSREKIFEGAVPAAFHHVGRSRGAEGGKPLRAGGHVTESRGADWSVASGPRLEGRAFAPLSVAAG